MGPLPGLGGPFSTATECFKAWAKSANFVLPLDQVKEICKENFEEIAAHIAEFPLRLEQLAPKISFRDQGPFPLFHADYGHHNIVVDGNYNVLGVIDWEHACSVPWECIYFPWTLSVVPAPMVPDNYNDDGIAKDCDTRAIIDEQKKYIHTVQEMERKKGLAPLLSATLADRATQDVAYAMKLYVEDGICGQYTNILDVHQKRWLTEEGLGICGGASDPKGFTGNLH